ncbi:putative protease [uncultured Mediterranean phage uvMED]|nr:putative protease [uncultured Mediterranean phage uvMED]BAR22581.1 peptidase S14 ClpP [uncultured Mediterranean phage uvMED]
MNFSFVTNYIEGEKAAKLNIKKPIGSGINGAEFSAEMDYLADMGVEAVTIEINSVGGSIKEGFSIFSAIKDSPMKTTTRVVGISASMAGIISQAGDVRKIVDYGIFHAHGPQVPKGKKVEASLLDMMMGSLKTLISSKADLTAEQIDDIMGKETILTAKEAYDLGFFDEIEETRVKKPEFKVTNDIESLYQMANNFLIKSKYMDGLESILNLENATEADVIAKVEALQGEAAKVEGLENSVSELSEQVEALKNEKVELINSAASALIENAVKEGKLSEESQEKWLEAAKNDLEGTKELLGGVSVSKVSKVVEAVSITDNAISEDGDVENRKEWDFQQWGENDPKGLEAMRNENPEKYDALLTAYVED